jgi:hypothetical protein
MIARRRPCILYALTVNINTKEATAMNKFRSILIMALLLTILLVAAVAPAAAKVNEYEGQHSVIQPVEGDPSQWVAEAEQVEDEEEAESESISLNFAKIEY